MRSLLFFFLFVAHWAMAKQEVSFQQVVCSTVSYADVSCLKVRFDVSFTETYVDVLKQGDTADLYFIEVRLKSANGVVKANKGFALFADTLGQTVCVLRLPLSDTEKHYAAQVVYLPLAALALNSGAQSLQVEISVKDNWGKPLGRRWAFAPFVHVQPQLLQLSINVQSIWVDSLNNKGESWDYAGSGVEKSLPDLVWHVLFMQKKISTASLHNNTLLYEDLDNLNDVVFTIAKDDAFSVGVYDYDMPSYSDRIGQVRVDMNDMQKFSGSVFTTRSGKIKQMEFTVTIL